VRGQDDWKLKGKQNFAQKKFVRYHIYLIIIILCGL